MAHSYDFHQMRYIFSGAEKVKDETRHLYMERFGVRILEGYGTTETSPVLSVNSAHHITPGSVGRLLKGIEHRIEPVEGVDEGGRLFVKGSNVMLGYYRADKPGEIQSPEEGWHDTGDIVRIDAEGFLYIVGRAKRFAKIAGEMVSLGAIEDIIQSVFLNGEHAVLSLPDSHKGEKIVLVTTKKDYDRAQLISYIKSKGLSQLNVPAEIMIIEKMPILGTGKTDYVALESYVLEKMFDANSKI
jgi:acyl-[acyl-carrier-protein]-phospholipid O-acyltransferase/long-chain-fatty-acid--[acyl-carrier-protein] ligase